MADFKLPEITYPLSIDTIGKVMATAGEISMHCRTCRRHVRLNLVKIAKKHGMDYGCLDPNLRKVVVCGVCVEAGRDGRAIDFTLDPIAGPNSLWPRELNPPPHVPR